MKPPKGFFDTFLSAFLFLIAWSLATGLASAQTTVNATTSTGGNWTAPGTWTCSPALSPCLPNNTASDVFGVAINAGTVVLNNSSSLATIGVDSLSLASGANLQINDAHTLSFSGPITNNGSLYVDAAGGGRSMLTVGGDLTNSGTMQIGDGPAAGTVNVAGQQVTNTGTVNVYANSSLNVGGSTYSSGDYYQPAGTTSFYGGSTTALIGVDGGTLQAGGNATLSSVNVVGGVFRVIDYNGSATVNTGSYFENYVGTTAVQLNGTSAGQYSVINSTGVGLDGGNLNVAAGLTLGAGQTWNVVTLPAGNLVGLYGALQLNGGSQSTHPTYLDLGGGLTLDVNYDNSKGNIQLAVVNTPATRTDAWTNATGTWNSASDWTRGIPLSYSDVTIGNTSNGSVTLNQDATVNSLAINPGNTLQWQSGSNYSLTVGQTLTNGGAVNETGPGRMSVGGGVTNSGVISISNGAAAEFPSVSSGNVTNTGTINVDVTGPGGSTIEDLGSVTNTGGTLAIGNGGMSKADSVTLFGGLDNRGGTVNITGGSIVTSTSVLFVDNGGVLDGSYHLTGNSGGATLGYAGGVTQIGDGSSSSGALTLDGANALVESENSYATNSALTGLTTIASNGSLSLENGALVTTSGGLTNAGKVGIGSGSTLTVNAITAGGLSNSGTIDISDGAKLKISGPTPNLPVDIENDSSIDVGSSAGGSLELSGSGSTFDLLCKVDCGNIFHGGLVMAGNSSITGATGSETLINNIGSIIIGTGSISNLNFANIGELAANGGTLTTASLTNLSGGNLTGGTYEALGGSTLRIPGDINQIISATIVLDGAGSTITDGDGVPTMENLRSIEGSNGSSAGLFVDDGTQLTTSGNLLLANSGQLVSGLGAHVTVNGSLSLDSGSAFVFAGSASLNITGNLTNSNYSSITVNGAPYPPSGPGAIVAVSGDASNDATSYLVFQSGGAVRISGGLANSGHVVGGLITPDSGDSTLSVDGAFTNSAGAVLELMANGDSVTAGSFSNHGSVSLLAETTLTVSGTGGYAQTGGTTDVNGSLIAPTVMIDGGTLSGTGTIQGNVTIGANGILSPGDAPGTIHITGPLNIAGTLDEAVNSASIFDLTDITGELTLGSNSTLDIMLASGFDPAVGTSLTIMDFDSLDGTFGSILNDTFDNGTEDWVLAYNANDIVLTAAARRPTPEPASLLLFGTGLLGMAWALRRKHAARL